MSDQAILVVSFGTSFDDTREKTIAATQAQIRRQFPDYAVYSAFTSGMVRGILKQRGIDIPSVEDTLEQILRDGVKRLAVQPTHLLYGDEYDKMRSAVAGQASRFERVTVGAPLLSDYSDMYEVLSALDEGIPRELDEALVLMGHGTGHFSNTTYAAMDYFAKANGFEDVFVGTVEAWPDLDEVVSQVLREGFTRAVLTPLMLVAGDHAQNDMAGEEPRSWRSVFAANGLQTRCMVRGLGEYESVRALYCAHIERALTHEL
ncbi:MAG: Sirohydrochlorin cobaltochelatase CbiK [Oscillospiraceae bacterium]|nr:Sirohydrochlorin cobaltochelatase CbiK [Oscillospiraceae bacterium]